MTNNPNDLEQRISERRDLGTADAAELAKRIAQDPHAARLDKNYARLDQILSAWRTLPAGVDFRSFRGQVAGAVVADLEYRVLEARAAGQSADAPGLSDRDARQLEQAYAATDNAIRSAVQPMPAVDWGALKNRISIAVRTEAAESDPHHERTILLPADVMRPAAGSKRDVQSPARRYRYKLQRFALPLSAAAAIGITATLWFRGGPSPHSSAITPVANNRVLIDLGAPVAAGTISVAFDETPMTAAADEPPTRGAAIAIGPGHDEAFVLPDDALWQ